MNSVDPSFINRSLLEPYSRKNELRFCVGSPGSMPLPLVVLWGVGFGKAPLWTTTKQKSAARCIHSFF